MKLYLKELKFQINNFQYFKITLSLIQSYSILFKSFSIIYSFYLIFL